MKKIILATAVLGVALSSAAIAQDTPSNPDAKVYFANIADGDTLKSPVNILFGLSGMGIAPAGVDKEMTGHHHLLIDRPTIGEGEDGADEFIYSIPADDNHKHFGKGQTETMLELAPGTHTLQLVLGDKDHIPHNPPIFSEVITVTVE